MWVFTSKGMISAVAHWDKPGHLMVRARKLDHLQAIFPGSQVTQLSNADYRYRVTVTSEGFKQVMLDQIDNIQYDNFKNSIVDHQYHDACTSVWSAMHRIQPGSFMARVQADEQDDLWNVDLPETHHCSSCLIELPDGVDCNDCFPTD